MFVKIFGLINFIFGFEENYLLFWHFRMNFFLIFKHFHFMYKQLSTSEMQHSHMVFSLQAQKWPLAVEILNMIQCFCDNLQSFLFVCLAVWFGF